jgi:hypothetical protein
MTEFRVSGRSDLDTGEAGKGRSDAPMDFAMEMAMPATPTAAVTADATLFVPMERIWTENGEGGAKPWQHPATGGAELKRRYDSRHRH